MPPSSSRHETTSSVMLPLSAQANVHKTATRAFGLTGMERILNFLGKHQDISDCHPAETRCRLWVNRLLAVRNLTLGFQPKSSAVTRRVSSVLPFLIRTTPNCIVGYRLGSLGLHHSARRNRCSRPSILISVPIGYGGLCQSYICLGHDLAPFVLLHDRPRCPAIAGWFLC